MLRHPAFRLFFAGQVTSMLGDNMAPAALVLGAFALHKSATEGGLVLAASAVPMIALTLVGGVIADRFSRRFLMLGSDILRALAQFITGALFLSHAPAFSLVLVTQVAYGVGNAFFEPASSGLMPELVDPDQLQAANGTLESAASTMRVIGPLVAAAIIFRFGTSYVLLCDGLTFLVSATCLSRLKTSKRLYESSAPILADLGIGFKELVCRRWLVVIIAYITTLTFTVNAPIAVLGPAVSTTRLGGPQVWTLMLAAFGAGTIVGSLIGMRLQSRHTPALCLMAMLTNVPLLILIAVGTVPATFYAACLLAGIGSGFFVVQWSTLLQQSLPSNILSRIASYQWLGTFALYPLGLAVVAPLAALVGLANLMLFAAVYLAGSTIVAIALVSFVDEASPSLAPRTMKSIADAGET